MDNQPQIRNINTAGGYVCCYAHAGLAVAQAFYGAATFVLPRSPEMATEEKPRSVRIACNWRTASRVWQNTIAAEDSIRRSTFTTVPAYRLVLSEQRGR